MCESKYSVEESSRFECPDVFFPNPLPKPNSTKRELLIDYGSCGNVYIYNTSSKAPINEKEYFHKNKLSAKYPTLPLAETALKVDYPFKDRIMGENLNNIKRARSFVYYMNRYRGLWVSKVPFSQLNPLKRVIEDMKAGDYDLKEILKEKASPALRSHIENYHHLLQKGSVEFYNSAYVGGCLTALKTKTGDSTVCFPSGPKFTNLNVRQIIPDEKDPYFYHYNDGIEMNIGHSIYEVRSTIIHGKGYCALRCGSNRCHLLRFHGEDFNSTVNVIETVNETPTSICPSPYIEGESLIATDSGTVHIWRVGRGLDAVILNNPTRFKCNDDWRQVHYGGCPQEIVIADRTLLKMFDRRTKCESSIDLFALPNNILLNSERISATCKHPVNPFQHITSTDYSLLVTDQRFPGRTVMYWNHILEKCPALLSVYNNDNGNYDNSLVMLASQYPAETCCFQFQQNSCEPVHSTQTPWRLSKISDMREFDCPMLNTYSLLSEKRLDTSLCGVAALPGFDKQSLLTLQLDAHGELFYQVYSDKANDVGDLTCSAGPGNSSSFFSYEAQDRAKTWMLSLETHVNQFCENKNVLERSVFDKSDLLPLMMNVFPPKELCPICQPRTQVVDQNVNDSTDDVPCQACGLTFQSATALCDAEKEEKIADISCNAFENFSDQIPSYTKFPHESARSNIFIKLWMKDSDISEYVKKADKDTRKYKESFKKKQKVLTKRVEKRRERFRILRRHGHDINSIYIQNRKNPSELDKSIKVLASQYPDEDQATSNQPSNMTTSLSSFESQQSKQPDYRANITRLLQDSRNLSQLQQLPSSCSSSLRSDSVSSNKQRKEKKKLDAASVTSSQMLTDGILEDEEAGPLSPVFNRTISKSKKKEAGNKRELSTSKDIQEDISTISEMSVEERKPKKKKSANNNENESSQALEDHHDVAPEKLLSVTSTKKKRSDRERKSKNSDTVANRETSSHRPESSQALAHHHDVAPEKSLSVFSTKKKRSDRERKSQISPAMANSETSSHRPEMEKTPLEPKQSKKGKRNTEILSSGELEQGHHQGEVNPEVTVEKSKSKSFDSESKTVEHCLPGIDEDSVIPTKKSRSKKNRKETYSDTDSSSWKNSEKKKFRKSKTKLCHAAPETEEIMSICEQDSPEMPVRRTSSKKKGGDNDSSYSEKYEKKNNNVERECSLESAAKKRKSRKSNKKLDIENESLQEPGDVSLKKTKLKKKGLKDLSKTESSGPQKSSRNEDEGRESSPEAHTYKRKSKKKKQKKKHSDSESDYCSSQYSSDNSTSSKKKSKKNKKRRDYDSDSSSSHKSADGDTLHSAVYHSKNRSKFDCHLQDDSQNKHIVTPRKDKKKTSILLQEETVSANSTSNNIFKVPLGLPPRSNKRFSLLEDKASKKASSRPPTVDEDRANQKGASCRSTRPLQNASSTADVIDNEAENSWLENENEHVKKKSKKKSKKRRKDLENNDEGGESDFSVESCSSVSSFGSEMSLFSNQMDIGGTPIKNEKGVVSGAFGDERRHFRKKRKKDENKIAFNDHLDSNDSSVYTSDQDSGSDRSQKKKRKKKWRLTPSSQDSDTTQEPYIDNTLRLENVVASSTVPENSANSIRKEEVPDIRRKHRKKSSNKIDNISIANSSISDIKSKPDLDIHSSLTSHSCEPSNDNDQYQTDILFVDDSKLLNKNSAERTVNKSKNHDLAEQNNIPQNAKIQSVKYVKPDSHIAAISPHVKSDQIPSASERDTTFDQNSFATDYGVHPEYTGDVIIGYVCDNVENSNSVDNCRRTNVNDDNKPSTSRANASGADTSRDHHKRKVEKGNKHAVSGSSGDSVLVNSKSESNDSVSLNSTFPSGSHHNVRIKTENINEEESADLNLTFSPHFSSSPYMQLQHKPVLGSKSKNSKKKKTKFAIGF